MDNIKKNNEKSFDFAADVAKQLITLSTAIITITITFSKDILNAGIENKCWLLAAWIAFLISIFFGIWTLMALTGSLEPISHGEKSASINGKNVRLPAVLQVLSFITALVLTITYGFKSINEEINDSVLIENSCDKGLSRVIRKSSYVVEPNEVIDTLILKQK